MKKINLLLPVESIARELDYKLFLAASLVSKNINVIIAQHDYFNSPSSSFKGGVYIGKNIFKSLFPQCATEDMVNLNFYKNLKENDISLFHLDEEGGIYPEGEDRWRLELDSRLNPKFLMEDDHIFTWGSYQKKHYESKESPVQNSNIIVCGQPRFEICKPRFRDYYKKSIEEIKSRYGSFILINTNQCLANGLMGLERTLLDFGGRLRYTLNDEKERFKFISWWSHQNKVVANFVVLIHRLSITFPDKIFILRPHPGENPNFYRAIFSVLKNVHIENTGAVSPWIMASDLVIHDGCTTAIESFLAEVPIIYYNSVINDPYEIKLPNQLGTRCTSEEDVIRTINDLDRDSSAFIKKNSLTPSTISLMKNLESDIYDDFISLCNKLIKDKLDKNTCSGKISLLGMHCKEFLHSSIQCLRTMVRAFFPVKLIQFAAAKVHFSGFNRSSINEKILSIEHMTQKKVSLKYLSSRLMVMTSEDDGK